MDQKKSKYYVALLFSLGLSIVNAQNGTVSSGGDASAAQGSVAYSVGQPFYTTSTGTNGSVAQGVQQPFEIQEVLGTDLFSIQLKMLAYPNPTTDVLNLTIEENDVLSDMSYQLIDFNGRVIKSSTISNQSTTIPMAAYQKAIYMLTVTQNNTIIKTFKIIKK
ncbi:T9SS type A sorting domain-containing protein [Flavobacterium jejuense]|uniref:T9SS type A sorting domain-containing protein n=1 Tax=Flavobacterium jejuense TaxID=1544455 RepID=A0ABX0IMT0_9FLAO|nr:T9SS type A sorting domain-containing protein [Flavobacterium jejuense]NHN25028.1 T9SS type A sorting domain-containing protein [Flavobacterium jejuense]